MKNSVLRATLAVLQALAALRAPALCAAVAEGGQILHLGAEAGRGYITLTAEELDFFAALPEPEGGYRPLEGRLLDSTGRALPPARALAMLAAWYREEALPRRRSLDARRLNHIYFERAFALEPEERRELEEELARRRAYALRSGLTPPSRWASEESFTVSFRDAPGPAPARATSVEPCGEDCGGAPRGRRVFVPHAPEPPAGRWARVREGGWTWVERERWAWVPEAPARPCFLCGAASFLGRLLLAPFVALGAAARWLAGGPVVAYAPPPPPEAAPLEAAPDSRVQVLHFTGGGCEACARLERRAASLRERLSDYGDRFELRTVALAENRELARRYRVRSPRTFILLVDGRVRGRFEEEAGFEGLEPRIRSFLGGPRCGPECAQH